MSVPTILVTIPGCTATHVLGETAVDLSSGDLALVLSDESNVSAPTSSSSNSLSPTSTTITHNPVLTLTIGTAAFPLFPTTYFGTQAFDSRVYLFSPEIGPLGGGRGGFIKVTLPDGVKEEGSYLGKIQEEFEIVLVKHGLLKEGAAAAGDEVSMSVKESTAAAVTSLEAATQVHLERNPVTTSPTSFSSNTHLYVDSAAQGTKTASEWTKSASHAIGDAATSAGAWIGKTVGSLTGGPKQSSSQSSLGEGIRNATGGITDAAASLSSSMSTAAQTVIVHDYGAEVGHVASASGETVVNAAFTVGNALAGTSGVMQGVKAVGGYMDDDSAQAETRVADASVTDVAESL